MNKIARVFARKTEQCPDDELVFFDYPVMQQLLPEIHEVHVSCTFTYDKSKAEDLAHQWVILGVPVKIGGPAYGDYTKYFTPGMYLKKGFVITSTGCPNKCWFCSVPKRAGGLKELEIKEGYIVQDDNFLACSKCHIKAVFDMLARQKQKAEFRGGLEAKLLKPWHIELFLRRKPETMYFAYDTPDDKEPLFEAGKLLKQAGITIRSRIPRAYVLMGWKGDTMEKAQARCIETLEAGFIPFAMLYRDDKGTTDKDWRNFYKQWLMTPMIHTRYPQYFK